MDVNKLYGWALLQKLPLKGFEWVEDISKFKESLIKSCIEKSKQGYLLKIDIQYA